MTYQKKIAMIKKLATYDFEDFRERFANMTDEAVRQEYVAVVNGIRFLESCVDDMITEYAFFSLSEPLLEAEDYMARYLAILHCREHGYSNFEG